MSDSEGRSSGGTSTGATSESPGGSSDPAAVHSDDAATLLREARETLDGQLHALTELDRKAFRLIQFTTAFVSAVVAALSFAPRSLSVVNAYTTVGVACLLLATLVAAASYATSPRIVGVDAVDLERALGLSKAERERALVNGYADWIRVNDAADGRAALQVTVSILFLAAGVLGVTLGVVRAFSGSLSPVTPVLAVVGWVVTAYVAGVHRQLRRFLRGRGRRRRRGQRERRHSQDDEAVTTQRATHIELHGQRVIADDTTEPDHAESTGE